MNCEETKCRTLQVNISCIYYRALTLKYNLVSWDISHQVKQRAKKGKRSIYTQYVLFSLVQLCGRADAERGSQAQDLRQRHRLLPVLHQLQVLVLLRQVAHHDVVVHLALHSMVTLVYDDQAQVCQRQYQSRGCARVTGLL